MTEVSRDTSTTAEDEGDRAIAEVLGAIESGHDFKLEAGAGAGKTHSLIEALNFILVERKRFLPRSDQRVACLTYTNVAKDEIISRTDGDPAIFASTLHGFLWEMIKPYQKALTALLPRIEKWGELISDGLKVVGKPVSYDLGLRRVHDDYVSLHHDDIPFLAIQLFGEPKFRALLCDRFPIIFVDEYQDTPAGLIEALLGPEGDGRVGPLVGLFGDHWQQIYDKSCGSFARESIRTIEKNSNFRSDQSVVAFLNLLRPELPQVPGGEAGVGSVVVYHTSDWPGPRLSRHWKGQVPHDVVGQCLNWLAKESPSSATIAKSAQCEFLMLTHAMIANELGYAALSDVYKYNDAFVRKEDVVIEYLVDTIEPAISAFVGRHYGELFRILGRDRPLLRAPCDKQLWKSFFDNLIQASTAGTVGDLLDLIFRQTLFGVPDAVVRTNDAWSNSRADEGREGGEPLERVIVEYGKLRKVPFSQLRSLSRFLSGESGFATQHSVKGAQFDDVVVVVGRGWSKYDFGDMLHRYTLAADVSPHLDDRYLRSRNLFYVAASRARHNLILLIVQDLDSDTVELLEDWLGPQNVRSIVRGADGSPVLA